MSFSLAGFAPVPFQLHPPCLPSLLFLQGLFVVFWASVLLGIGICFYRSQSYRCTLSLLALKCNSRIKLVCSCLPSEHFTTKPSSPWPCLPLKQNKNWIINQRDYFSAFLHCLCGLCRVEASWVSLPCRVSMSVVILLAQVMFRHVWDFMPAATDISRR